MKNKKRRIINIVSLTLTKTNTFINLSEISYNEIGPRRPGKPKSIEKRSSRTLTYTSGGICGFKGKIKANPMTSATIGDFAAVKFKKFGVRHIHLNLLGKGRRKKEIVRAFNAHGVAIDKIAQRSPYAHNGVRRKKKRRK